MNANDLGCKFFTTNGHDVWMMEFFYSQPSCTLINLETKEKKNFGMGGLTAESFKPIVMPK